MYSKKSLILLLACIVAFVAASPLDLLEVEPNFDVASPVLVRQVRSPDGSVDIKYKDDRAGREASVQYNQNLYKSGDGRVNVDAYGYGNRNFDANRNSYGGGIQGRIRF